MRSPPVCFCPNDRGPGAQAPPGASGVLCRSGRLIALFSTLESACCAGGWPPPWRPSALPRLPSPPGRAAAPKWQRVSREFTLASKEATLVSREFTFSSREVTLASREFTFSSREVIFVSRTVNFSWTGSRACFMSSSISFSVMLHHLSENRFRHLGIFAQSLQHLVSRWFPNGSSNPAESSYPRSRMTLM